MKDEIDSTLKLIDESNKSFILNPLSFVLKNAAKLQINFEVHK